MTSEIIYKFQEYLTEAAKAEEKKTTKEVNEKEIAGYDYKDKKNLNNQIFDQYLNGLRVELEKNPKLTIEEAKEVVAKNLEKDPIYYTKNAAFKIDGIGYEESKKQEEPTGKYKSSGYGDLKENEMSKSDDLKELLEEAVAGIPSIGNPFANRSKEAYENKFESFLAEENINDPKGPTAHGNIAEEDQEEEYVGDDERYEYEKGKKAGEKEEKKKMKKEGRMKMSEVLKEAERMGEIAKKKVEAKIYERAIAERKKAMSINEDESLSEFINQEAIKEVEKEIKELEKKLMEVSADKNTMTGGKWVDKPL